MTEVPSEEHKRIEERFAFYDEALAAIEIPDFTATKTGASDERMDRRNFRRLHWRVESLTPVLDALTIDVGRHGTVEQLRRLFYVRHSHASSLSDFQKHRDGGGPVNVEDLDGFSRSFQVRTTSEDVEEWFAYKGQIA